MTETERAPRLQIRRFDIFAEWNRLKATTRHHMQADDARAYGLAVAKVVAARKLHGADPEKTRELKRQARQDEVKEPWWEHLGTSAEFEQKIVERMGREFYAEVFQPAVKRAWDAGQRYEDIRDKLREDWNQAAKRLELSKPPRRQGRQEHKNPWRSWRLGGSSHGKEGADAQNHARAGPRRRLAFSDLLYGRL